MAKAQESDCKACHGTSQRVDMQPRKLGEPIAPYVSCPACNGTGKKP